MGPQREPLINTVNCLLDKNQTVFIVLLEAVNHKHPQFNCKLSDLVELHSLQTNNYSNRLELISESGIVGNVSMTSFIF